MLTPETDTGDVEPLVTNARRAFGSGNLWAWGEGTGGVLGNGDEQNVETPAVVNRLRGFMITDAACGEFHALAVASTGELFAWGSNKQASISLIVCAL